MTKPLTEAEIAEVRSIASDPQQLDTVRQSEVLRLLDEVTRTRALLRRIEWRGRWNDCPGGPLDACPDCGSLSMKHAPDCELAALIGGEEGVLARAFAAMRRLTDLLSEAMERRSLNSLALEPALTEAISELDKVGA